MTTLYRVVADRDRCMGAGQCVARVPDVFDQDDDGLVIILETAPGPGLEDAVRRAVAFCPSKAIGYEAVS